MAQSQPRGQATRQPIRYTRGKRKKLPLYRDLVKAVQDTLGYAQGTLMRTTAARLHSVEFELWCGELAHYTALIERVIEQTRRRVLDALQAFRSVERHDFPVADHFALDDPQHRYLLPQPIAGQQLSRSAPRPQLLNILGRRGQVTELYTVP